MSKKDEAIKRSAALATTSQRFVEAVERQFRAELGSALHFTQHEKILAQHLFVKIDSVLKELEAKRQESGNKSMPAYAWENINLSKLAIDAVHRINLGLDALIPNHIHPIPFLNKRTKKYDLDLRVGYQGKLFTRMELAVERPKDIIISLVHETDTFIPHMRSHSNPIEHYEFKINNPFDRGKVIGGFGYIVYDDPTKNRLVIVTPRDFEKAEKASQTNAFWGDDKWRLEMMRKTVIHRVADQIPLDPRKINAPSYAYVEAQEADSFEDEVDKYANTIVIDSDGVEDISQQRPLPSSEEIKPEPEPEPEIEPEIEADGPSQLGPDF